MITIRKKDMSPCDRIAALVAQRRKPIAVLYPNGLRVIVTPEGGSPQRDVLPTDGVDVVNGEGKVVRSFFPSNPDYDVFFCGSSAAQA